ncbi:MAG TPA: hypothetical protein VE641_02660 [Chthoniobacterales bacterium]|nr:hypothetical protein [Chthoniobacterales bacterium]
MKFPLHAAMPGVVAKSLFVASFITSVPVFADTLVAGSAYFDSLQTLTEVNKLSAQHDDDGIAKLAENGHIRPQITTDMDIVVLLSGTTPEDPAEFRFLNGPTTYWTLTKNVANLTKPIAVSTPTPGPMAAATPGPSATPTLELTPAPTESPTATSKHHRRQHESNAPFDDDNGRRTWHKVDGKWKWYLTDKHPAPVKKASPAGETAPTNP